MAILKATLEKFPKVDELLTVQIIPSGELAIEFVPPPTATKLMLLLLLVFGNASTFAIPCTADSIADEDPVQLIPLDEVAILFVPCPPATHKESFHDTVLHLNVKILFPLPVQLIPSGEVANEFAPVVPSPPATHKEPFQATA